MSARQNDERLRSHAACRADIFEIWSYIAEDNEKAADRVEQAIYDACAFVAEVPAEGVPAPTSPDIRCVSGRLPVIPTTPLSTGLRLLHFRLSPFYTGKGMCGIS